MTPSERTVAFGQRIATLRESASLTRLQVAQGLGISQSMVGFIERGERFPGPDTLCGLADLLATSVDDLLGRAEPEQSTSLWVAMSTRITRDEQAHRRLATQSWDVHAYTESIRERALADGLAAAREAMLRVLADVRSTYRPVSEGSGTPEVDRDPVG